MTMTVHATAVVENGAELGSNVEVGPFCYVQSGARIGDGCVLGPNVTILAHTTLGRECSVHAGAVLGDVPQDTGFKSVFSEVRIGDRCRIREGVSIHRGTKEGTATEIGDDCFLMGLCHLAHNVRLGNNVIVANAVLLAGYVQIDDGVFISGGTGVHQFVRIGRLAMLGGGGGISKDVPPFCTTQPISLNEILGLNVIGMRRAGISPEERLEIKRAFRILYRSGLNVTQAAAKIRKEFSSSVALEFCSFIEVSERGLCVPARD